MPQALYDGKLLGREEMGAFKMRVLHQVRGLGVQPSWVLCRGQMGLLRELPEADGE